MLERQTTSGYLAALTCILVGSFLPGSVCSADSPTELRVHPRNILFTTPESSVQILVWGKTLQGKERDVTREASFRVSTEGIVSISSHGRIEPLSEGKCEVQIASGNASTRLEIEVRGFSQPPRISFQNEIIPILSKAGCNAGGCHGKAEGQNGFKLSVFGFDSVSDHRAITKDARGRRIFPADPQKSLLLSKATAAWPHGGGLRIAPDSVWHRRLVRWIAEGATSDRQIVHPVTSIRVEPAAITLGANARQQLRVVAMGDHGDARCVTAEADFQSNNDPIASVDRDGLVAVTDVPGEAAILVRYLGHVAVCRVTRPRDSSPTVRPSERNFIDRLIWNKLEELRIPTSSLTDDATYLRRVYLDTIGTLPTSQEVRQFFADSSGDKRRQWAANLLSRPEYSDYWAQKWADILQVDKDTVTPQGAVAMTRWIRDQLRRNVPFDSFAKSIITAQGSTLAESPAAFFQVQADAERSARALSQLLLGVRIECAQCHHHPFERWDQQDYYALAGFFTGVERKGHPQGGIKIVDGPGADLKNPRTGLAVPPAGLGATPMNSSEFPGRRQAFAEWATKPDNPFFSRTIANRIWAHYFGRGLVEPVDDLRATNPASNEPLLDALSQYLVELRFDLRAFTLTILDSHAYQLSSETITANELDEQNYSHAVWKTLPAEVLLDAVSQVTGVLESFNGWPRGYRAIQVWDNKLPSHFLEVFGRPRRLSVCSCERGVEPSIAQALHLMNSPNVADKISARDGRAAQLTNSRLTNEAIVDEVYLSALGRFPSTEERRLMVQNLDSGANRREAVEDIFWAVLNTKEFVYSR